MKKDQIYPTKTIIVIIVQENHFQITQITLDNNDLTIRVIVDDHQTKEFHEISHKTDIVDQTVKKISIEINNWMTQVFTQSEPNLKNDPTDISSDTTLSLPEKFYFRSTPSLSQISPTLFLQIFLQISALEIENIQPKTYPYD